MSGDEVAALLKGLTEAQRKAIITGRARNWPCRNKMVELGLATPGGGLDVTLTDRGARVRKILLRRAADARA